MGARIALVTQKNHLNVTQSMGNGLLGHLLKEIAPLTQLISGLNQKIGHVPIPLRNMEDQLASLIQKPKRKTWELSPAQLVNKLSF